MKNVYLCGDDKRFIECKKYLRKENINIDIINEINNIKKDIYPDVIVLPIKGINTILDIYHYLFNNFKDSLFVVYNITPLMDEYIRKNKLKIYDLKENKEFAKLNNIATAEVTLKYINELIPQNFNEINVAILGYGKCAKEVFNLYNKLDIKSNVFVRREEVKNELGENGYLLEDLEDKINNYDLIVNTIPYNVINNDLLHKISLHSILLDLSSYPYGWNHEVANDLGLYSYILKGLPGIYKYKTIGKELARILKEVE